MRNWIDVSGAIAERVAAALATAVDGVLNGELGCGRHRNAPTSR
jgi:hypothetical protein